MATAPDLTSRRSPPRLRSRKNIPYRSSPRRDSIGEIRGQTVNCTPGILSRSGTCKTKTSHSISLIAGPGLPFHLPQNPGLPRGRDFRRFAFLDLAVMTLSYAPSCDDVVFLQEHTGLTWLGAAVLPFQRQFSFHPPTWGWLSVSPKRRGLLPKLCPPCSSP